MNETMQSISFSHMSRPGTGRSDTELRTVRSAPTVQTGVRSRIRAILTRTTLGPVSGDHARADGQWWTSQGSVPVR